MIVRKTENMVRRLGRATCNALVGLGCIFLAGCGPEAPPCNDPESMQSILTLVAQAHDDHLKGLPYTSKDLATFKLDAVAPTAYDDKQKIRSCNAVYVATLSAKAAEESTKYASAMSTSLRLVEGLNMPFSSLVEVPKVEEIKRDLLALRILNPGEVRADPVRTSIKYQIQKHEGKQAFMVTTNVDVSQTSPYLRIASRAKSFLEQARSEAAKKAVESRRQAQEIDRLSASGLWRRVVYILSFREPEDSGGRCHERGFYCFQGFDGKDQFKSNFYQLDIKKFDERNRNAMTVAYRNGTPVCLGGVRRARPDGVFSAEGYSTFLNEKGEAVDCLPGTEKETWAETLARVGANNAGVPPRSTASPAPPTAPDARVAAVGSATPSEQPKPPESLTTAIVRYERCGSEAVCLHTARGNTIYLQVSQMRNVDFAMLDDAIKKSSTLCLRDVVRTEGKQFTAESLDSRC